ncbi:MAG: type IV pilus biogenesis/stability protein PilW [Gammaproteobacteria bacterium]|nr:type IV pilus biogenesis/stability protein PilW [Gammaproteobacteria bacterium]
MHRLLLIVWLSFWMQGCASVQEQKAQMKAADTNMRLGVGYLQQGRIDDALEKLKKALAAEPDFVKAHSAIALVYERLGERDNAEEHFLEALELGPGDGRIHNNYAAFLCRSGRPVEAEPHFLQAIRSRGYRTPERALENLGVCAMHIPDYEKAEIYLRKALQMNPKLPDALLQMAHLSVEKKRFMSGRAYLQRLREVTDLSPDALWLGVLVEKKLGDSAAVRQYEIQLRKKYPDSNEARELMKTLPAAGGAVQ